jgi:acylphosphatase
MEGIFMMKRAEIRIRGNVQMAGFRTFIKNVADSFNLTGFAENQGDGSVKVVCEGEEEGIKRLIDSVKKKSPSFVSIEGGCSGRRRCRRERDGGVDAQFR